MPISRIYLAPMEGVTTFIYRNAHAAVYGPLDKYFTPFLEPHEKRSMKTKERNEVLSQHNEGLHVVPQILTNHAEGFLELTETLQEMGYQEIISIFSSVVLPQPFGPSRNTRSPFFISISALRKTLLSNRFAKPFATTTSLPLTASAWKRTKSLKSC